MSDYSVGEVRAIAQLYWELWYRYRAVSDSFASVRMYDFKGAYDLLTDNDKRLVFRDVWLEVDGANASLVFERICMYLNNHDSMLEYYK